MQVDKDKKPRVRTKKKDITLMTLLAVEATKESQDLLVKHGQPKATDYADLEIKLAELYFNDKTDKQQLEKEMAEIHPHKGFILRNIRPEPKPVETKVNQVQETIQLGNVAETKSPCDGCKGSCGKSSSFSSACGCSSKFSGFDGPEMPKTQKVTLQNSPVTIIALVAVVGITFYFLHKTLK